MPKFPPQAAGGGGATGGTYTGNNTANRAIAHGLGVVPKIVFITLASGLISLYQFRIFDGLAYIIEIESTEYAVTAPDATNFYVGNAGSYGHSANESGKPYRWAAA